MICAFNLSGSFTHKPHSSFCVKIFHQTDTSLVFQPIFKPVAVGTRVRATENREAGKWPKIPTREALEETGWVGNWDSGAELSAMEDGVAASELQ